MMDEPTYEAPTINPGAIDKVREFCEAAQLMAGLAFSSDEVRRFFIANGLEQTTWSRLQLALREVIMAATAAELGERTTPT